MRSFLGACMVIVSVVLAGAACGDDAKKSAADGGQHGQADAQADAAGDTSHDASTSDRDAEAGSHDAASAGDANTADHDASGSDAGAAADGGDMSHDSKAICKPGATYGAALSSMTLTATKISDAFAFTEGPVWIAEQGVLLFSDLQPAAGPQNVQPSKIQQLTPPSTFTLWKDDTGNNGMALSTDGKSLYACTHDNQAISAYDLATKARTTLVASYGGKTFHSPNDLTVRSDGTIYFTDPSFQQGNRNTNIVDKTRVYWVAPGAEPKVVDESLDNPNGIALSPDEKTLYVDSNDGKVHKYSVATDGSTTPNGELASGLSAPDGMSVDCAGNVYVAEFNSGKVHVYAPSGTELGTIQAGTNVTNCAFGGSDGKTLFITSGGGSNYGIYAIKLGVPGLPY